MELKSFTIQVKDLVCWEIYCMSQIYWKELNQGPFCPVFNITQQESQKVGEEMCLYPRVEDTQCINIGVRQMDAIPEVNHFQ